jgi:RimJ/RimL family protein N-acetyltransferase
MIEIQGSRFRLRPWRWGDEDALVRHADNHKIWRNLRDHFPHPYTFAEAQWWLRRCEERHDGVVNLAIEVDHEAAGGIGYLIGDAETRVTARIGYWLGERYWGRGIATEALKLMTDHAFTRHPELTRIEACVFEWNPASARVLEKAGYALEARMRRCCIKDGQVIDQFLYAKLRD